MCFSSAVNLPPHTTHQTQDNLSTEKTTTTTTTNNACENNHLQLSGFETEPRPVYNTENKNKLPPRSSGECKSHTHTHTHSSQGRQTTTTSADLLGEPAITQQHKQGVFEGIGDRERSVYERERERESEREWNWNLVANKSQTPARSQVNWIIESRGRYRHRLPRIAGGGKN